MAARLGGAGGRGFGGEAPPTLTPPDFPQNYPKTARGAKIAFFSTTGSNFPRFWGAIYENSHFLHPFRTFRTQKAKFEGGFGVVWGAFGSFGVVLGHFGWFGVIWDGFGVIWDGFGVIVGNLDVLGHFDEILRIWDMHLNFGANQVF